MQPGARNGLLQVGDQQVRVEVLAAEVAVEQRLVLALGDDGLEQARPDARPGARPRRPWAAATTGPSGSCASPLTHVEHPAAGQRQVQRVHPLAERGLAAADRRVEVGPRLVQLGHGDRPGQADGGALRPQLLGPGVDLLGRRHHEQRGVGGAQPGPQLGDEVRVAGGVQQVDLAPGVLERRERERHRALLAAARRRCCPRPWCRPRRGRRGTIVPVRASSASTSVVLPAPERPTTTTLRTWSGGRGSGPAPRCVLPPCPATGPPPTGTAGVRRRCGRAWRAGAAGQGPATAGRPPRPPRSCGCRCRTASRAWCAAGRASRAARAGSR